MEEGKIDFDSLSNYLNFYAEFEISDDLEHVKRAYFNKAGKSKSLDQLYTSRFEQSAVLQAMIKHYLDHAYLDVDNDPFIVLMKRPLFNHESIFYEWFKILHFPEIQLCPNDGTSFVPERAGEIIFCSRRCAWNFRNRYKGKPIPVIDKSIDHVIFQKEKILIPEGQTIYCPDQLDACIPAKFIPWLWKLDVDSVGYY